MIHWVVPTSHYDVIHINGLGRPVAHLSVFSPHNLSATVESTVHSRMSLRSILFEIMKLDIDTFALVVILEEISVLRWFFQGLLVLLKWILIWLFHGFIFLLNWLFRLILMDPRYKVLFRGSSITQLESGVFIIWIANTYTDNSFWNAFQIRDVTDVNVCLGWTHIERQFEDTTVKFIVYIKHVDHCPSIAHILVS